MRGPVIATVVIVVSLGAELMPSAFAHPASGIVVDDQGTVLFVHSRVGVARVDVDGKLTYIHRTSGGHWMCLDPLGSFSHTQPQFGFERITADGVTPAIIFADGGAPVAVCTDGNLYYGSNMSTDGGLTPGGLTVARMTPQGKVTELSSALSKKLHEFDDGVTGLAAGPNGSLYVACWRGVLRVTLDGTLTTIAYPMAVSNCDEDRADNKPSNPLPYLRGIAVASDGTVFAAATSCHRLLKITPDGQTNVALSSERPWSPTGVAIHNGNVYVLEYTDPNQLPAKGQDWRPRVRKIASDGSVTTLVTLPREKRGSSEP